MEACQLTKCIKKYLDFGILLLVVLMLGGCLSVLGLGGFKVDVDVNNQNMGTVIGLKRSYAKNSVANITAQANAGYAFVRWEGNIPSNLVKANPLKLTVTEDLKIKAYFEPIGKVAQSYKSLDNHNPLLSHKFGADPYALAYGDRVYVYSTNDIFDFDSQGNIKENHYGHIHTINRISSDDMVNWTDHGSINIGRLQTGKAKWAGNSWAPAAVYKNINGSDQFFLYFANSANGVGVLTSDNPVGPFRDPISKPLVSRSTPNSNVPWIFDPAVIIDDNGQGYLYFGGGVPEGEGEMPLTGRVVELGDDMVSLAGTPKVIEAPFFFEAAFVNKIADTYYYSYCANWDSRAGAKGPHIPDAAEISYMTSNNPMGPWEYQGTILKNPGQYFGSWGNNHHSLVEFQGKWYIFYHTRVLEDAMGINKGYRSTHVDEVSIAADGSINEVIPTRKGVQQIKHLNPYQLHEAETMAWSGGISVIETKEPSDIYGSINMVVAEMGTGSFVGVAGADFGGIGTRKFTAKVASVQNGNAIKVIVDNPENNPIGYLEVPNTGSLDNFVEVTIDVDTIAGVRDLFFVFVGKDFHFDAWSFDN